MTSEKESENTVFEAYKKVKEDVELLLGRKTTRKNYKQAIVDVSSQIVSKSLEGDTSNVEQVSRISNFFDECKYLLGEVVWSQVEHKRIKIEISYDNLSISRWDIPIDMIFTHEDTFKAAFPLIQQSFDDVFNSSFLNPLVRKYIMDGDEASIKWLYTIYEKSSPETCLAISTMLRDVFPDFYKHITEKLDVMNTEEIGNTKKRKPNKKKKM